MADPICESRGIPSHLHRENRGPDDVFDNVEILYRRTLEYGIEGDKPNIEAFTTRSMSVNRNKYSQSPKDVLYNTNGPPHHNHTSMKIVAFRVGDVEVLIKKHPTKEIVYRLKVRHKPEQCMYPHCEVDIFEDNNLITDIKAASIKLWIKKELARAAWVVP